ncbi:MAG: replication restart helicase PriA [Planctomycetota bacterium]|jgi:primosomal protein N' (replication factor Y)
MGGETADLFGETAAQPDAPGRFVEVALKLPLKTAFTYRLEDGQEARPGSRVRVPFRGKDMPGVVVRLRDECGEVPAHKIRAVREVLDHDLVLPEALLQLASRMTHDYGCSLGEALDAMLPAVAKQRGVRKIPHLELAIRSDEAEVLAIELEDRFEQQARVLRALVEWGAPMPTLQLQRDTGTSDSPWKTLQKRGSIRRVMIDEDAEPLIPDTTEGQKRHELNDGQRDAVDKIGAALDRRQARTFLLHGVTGSGKTEVYLQVLERARTLGRTAIVLVPEISLTPQTVGRFAARFPDVAVLHSGLTGAQRAQEWHRIQRGDAHVAIGARSALFAPLRDVGLIVIDEEHENSFKQDSTPRYHARETAIARAEIENAVVVLGSATPTLESYGRAKRGVYELITLPNRAGKGTLPRILVEDLRKEDKRQNFEGVTISRTLQNLMEERLATRDQIILFLNRRGFAPTLICPSCGTAVQCEHCDVSMTWHARRGRLCCHYCQHEKRRPEVCGYCQHPKLHELGAGTERVEAAVKQLFPQAIVARMDADTMRQRGAHERVLTAFRRRQIDILIGTQMIAKGHDFPDVTLVGVISADSGLFLPDFRAAERTFGLLYQVAGRAGRGDKPGTVVFQTLCPENYAVRAAAAIDYESFVQQELAFRRATDYPPYARLIRVLFEAPKEFEARQGATAVRDELSGLQDVEALGPAPAILARVRDRYRVHILAKCFTQEAFDRAMDLLASVEDRSTRSLRVLLDVDPLSMM